MAITTTVFIATSLDGFIARPDGALDWLFAAAPSTPEQDYGYAEFFKTVDALVMGRKTFETVQTFRMWPFEQRPVVVLTSRTIAIPKQLQDRVRTRAAGPAAVLGELEREGIGHVYIDGGVTIQLFLSANLVDRLIISVAPILIGSGAPLFGKLAHDIRLQRVASRAYPTGLVQNEYRVIRE